MKSLSRSRGEWLILRGMKKTEQRYRVDDVEVVLVRDRQGARWECEECPGRCEHILMAAAWMTLQSWSGEKRTDLH